jgi:hypothetical protein
MPHVPVFSLGRISHFIGIEIIINEPPYASRICEIRRSNITPGASYFNLFETTDHRLLKITYNFLTLSFHYYTHSVKYRHFRELRFFGPLYPTNSARIRSNHFGKNPKKVPSLHLVNYRSYKITSSSLSCPSDLHNAIPQTAI